jgi:hypothetical protein
VSTTLLRRGAVRHPPHDVATAITYTLRRLAHRIQALTRDTPDLQQQTTTLIEAFAPAVCSATVSAPYSAATVFITAGDKP